METHTFQDFDEFAGSVRDIDATMLLQNPTRRTWVINHVYLPGTHVQLGRLGSGNIVEGQSCSNGYLLYLPLKDDCAYSANGTVLDQGSFIILEPGCEFCVSTQSEHDWCSIFVPSHMVTHGSDLGEPSSGAEKMTCRVTQANQPIANRFRALVDQVMTTAACCLPFESSPAGAFAAGELLKVASVVAGERPAPKPHQEGRTRLSRRKIMSLSKELLERRRGEPIRVEELAAAAHVSERTLRTAFNEYFGVGPVRYLQLRQLHQVYLALRAADPEAMAVGEVFVQHGVWEFSRFASRYRLLFGERPSETLHTKRRLPSAKLASALYSSHGDREVAAQ